MIAETNDHLVQPEDACPNCGERRVDELVWMNDEDEQVQCATCSHIYSPPRASQEGGDANAAATQ